jgi:hypothetical protein
MQDMPGAVLLYKKQQHTIVKDDAFATFQFNPSGHRPSCPLSFALDHIWATIPFFAAHSSTLLFQSFAGHRGSRAEQLQRVVISTTICTCFF